MTPKDVMVITGTGFTFSLRASDMFFMAVFSIGWRGLFASIQFLTQCWIAETTYLKWILRHILSINRFLFVCLFVIETGVHACLVQLSRGKRGKGFWLTETMPFLSIQSLSDFFQQMQSELESIGLNVKVVVCDQGSNNRSMMKSLGVTVDSPHFEMNGKSLHVLYDPPHLLKNICNNLKKSGFMVGDNRVDWSHILTYFEIDSSLPIRMAPRLTERDIELPAFSSMKVRRMVISSSLNSAKSLHLRFLEESPCSCTKSLHGFWGVIFWQWQEHHPKWV